MRILMGLVQKQQQLPREEFLLLFSPLRNTAEYRLCIGWLPVE